MSNQKEKEYKEALKVFLANGGVIEQVKTGVSGREEGVPQSAWGKPKKKKEE